jgi:protein associated with RNAse G/E
VAEAEPAPDGRYARGAALPVASTKYDGSLHYRYDVSVVADHGDRILAWGAAGTPMTSYRGDLVAPRHLLRVHDDVSWWNLEVAWEPDWRPNKHYVNIALPSTWDDGVLRFVDLDLDVSWWADGRVFLLDADEFDEHGERWGYPRDVVDGAWAAVDEVRAMIEGLVWPLDGSLYDWRP